jgi:hypothetical protein
MCDCPTDEEMFRSIDRWIDERRWQLIGVGYGDPPSPVPWTYTIGLAEGYGHPELFTVGACCYTCSGSLLNALGDRVAAGERFDEASREPIVVDDRGVDVELHLRPVEGRALVGDWFAMWHRYYWSKPYEGPPLSVVQVVLPDRDGRFPWEPGCDPVTALRQQVRDQPPSPNRAMRRRTRHRR